MLNPPIFLRASFQNRTQKILIWINHLDEQQSQSFIVYLQLWRWKQTNKGRSPYCHTASLSLIHSVHIQFFVLLYAWLHKPRFICHPVAIRFLFTTGERPTRHRHHDSRRGRLPPACGTGTSYRYETQRIIVTAKTAAIYVESSYPLKAFPKDNHCHFINRCIFFINHSHFKFFTEILVSLWKSYHSLFISSSLSQRQSIYNCCT